MTIDEAIELLLTATEGFPFANAEPYYKAMELGIEALKRVKAERVGYETYAPDLLPGETAE